MQFHARVSLWCVWLSVALVGVVLTSAAVGPVHIDYLVVAKALLNGIQLPVGISVTAYTFSAVSVPLPGFTFTAPSVTLPLPGFTFTAPFTFPVPESRAVIVRQIRMPRIAVAAVVGFALASAGVVMQGFFRNPMADPSIIGVSSGAAVGAVATIAIPYTFPFALPVAAFVGALIAAFGVYLLATENGRTPVATLLLAGIAVQTFLGAIISFLLLKSGEGLQEAVFWLMGNLVNKSWSDVAISFPVVLVGVAILFVYARDMNVLLLGEEDAHTLGIEVERTKRILLAVASIVTGVAVAVSGVIGFVGLVVPHIMRLVVGPDHRILLPTSALAGAVFLVGTDTVARSVMGPAELPVGIVTAFLGAPFFLYLLRKQDVHSL